MFKTRSIACLFISKLVFILVLAFLAKQLIPYLGFFPYKNQLTLYHLPEFISALANFDGLHYLNIAQAGYAQYEQAFFPLYPALIKYLTPLFWQNTLLTGLIISNLSFSFGLILFSKLLKVSRSTFHVLLFVLCFPTSFFFQAVYTEGLFFLLLIAGLYLTKKGQYFWAGIVGILASLTRLIGAFLFIPIFVTITKDKLKVNNFNKVQLKKFFTPKALVLLTSFIPFIGLALYMLYLWQTTGDPLFFLNAQPIYGANRSNHLILLPQVYWRYLKIFFTADFSFAYFIAILEVVFFTGVFAICCYELIKQFKKSVCFRLSLALFSLVNILLPTLTGTFSSVPRYALFSLSIFFFFAELKSAKLKIVLLVFFSLFQALLLGFFIQGYFIS